MTKRIVVVGDKFEEFASNDMVMTISTAEQIFAFEESGYRDVLFELGQGISAERANRLIALAEQVNRRNQLLFSQIVKCGRRHVHKRNPENSLLSLPKKISERIYSADVHIDDQCELLTDHVSGQHLQGMVLIEAVRQMILAVTEEYFSDDRESPCSFIWNGINVEYLGYAFPVATKVIYTIDDMNFSKKKRLGFSISAEVIQRDSVVCSAKSTVEVFDRSSIQRREGKMAAQAVVALQTAALAQVQE